MREKDFAKLTKTQKLQIKPSSKFGEKIEVVKVLFLPIRAKMSGYGMSAFFVQDAEGNWLRGHDYDCFSFMFWQPNKIQMVRGDFEYGGVVFFMGEGKHKCTYSYGGTFNIGDS